MVAFEHTDEDQDRNLHQQGATGLAMLSLAMAAIGMVAFFWDGLTSLGAAWSRPEYSYGPMVPLITAYMTLRELHHHPVTPNRDSKMPGMLVVALGLLLGLVGNVTQIPQIILYGSIVVIGGLILILAGFRQGIRFWPGWLHLFFMLPLPSMVYFQVSTYLQLVSSQLGVEFIHLLDIPVYLEGNIIDLGIYKLQVAEACNGLRYLFPLLSFGWLFAVLYNGPHWHRVVLFLSTVPVTILMNSLRIGVIGVLVSHFGIEQAEGFLHYFEGWIIFMACVLILFIEAWLLRRFATRRVRCARILDIDFEGILGPLSKVGAIPATRPLVAASAALLIAGAVWQLAPSRAVASVDRQVFSTFPMNIGDRQGRFSTLEPTIERVLGADDYLIADYVSTDSRPPMNLFMAFYRSQTEGSHIHSPQVCIPGGGWEVSRWGKAQVSIPGNSLANFAVNRVIIQKGEQRQLVYYWFEQRGRQLTNDYLAKLHTIWDAMILSRSDGALVRVVTPIGNKAGAEAAADKNLKTFLKDVVPLLPDYLPGL